MTTRCWGCDSRAGLCDSNTLFSVGCLVEFFPKCIYIISVKIGHGKIQPVLLKRDIVGLPATGGGQGATTRADISPTAALSHQGQPQSCRLFVLPPDPTLFSILPKDGVGGTQWWDPSLSCPSHRWGRAQGLAPGFGATGDGQPGSRVPQAGSTLSHSSKGRSRLPRKRPRFQISEVSV